MMQHLVEMLDEEAKDIMASFNAERYYYYGVLLSSVHVTSPNFNDKKRLLYRSSSMCGANI